MGSGDSGGPAGFGFAETRPRGPADCRPAVLAALRAAEALKPVLAALRAGEGPGGERGPHIGEITVWICTVISVWKPSAPLTEPAGV